jgi:hypothetical protein
LVHAARISISEICVRGGIQRPVAFRGDRFEPSASRLVLAAKAEHSSAPTAVLKS